MSQNHLTPNTLLVWNYLVSIMRMHFHFFSLHEMNMLPCPPSMFWTTLCRPKFYSSFISRLNFLGNIQIFCRLISRRNDDAIVELSRLNGAKKMGLDLFPLEAKVGPRVIQPKLSPDKTEPMERK